MFRAGRRQRRWWSFGRGMGPAVHIRKTDQADGAQKLTKVPIKMSNTDKNSLRVTFNCDPLSIKRDNATVPMKERIRGEGSLQKRPYSLKTEMMQFRK